VAVNGAIGLATNGVPFYSVIAQEKDTLFWRQDNTVEETYTVNIAQATTYVGPDSGNGYLTNDQWYVYRMDPALLYTKVSDQHSAIIGFALDGYPIYGPYGYANADGSGGVILNTSSYRLTSTPRLSRQFFSANVSLGIVSGSAQAEYAAPTGEYIEDFEYIEGVGTLDQHNGRFVVTPEFPFGTYAYFVTVNPVTLQPAYPYIIGPTFRGQPTGLTFEYRGESIAALYDNGEYTMPLPPPNPNTDWSLRSPTGQFPNDINRFQSPAYRDWYNNYAYTLTDLAISNPGRGYTTAPSIDISGNATAVCTIDPVTGSIASVVLTRTDTYTTMPTVVVDNAANDAADWQSSQTYSVNDEVEFQGIVYYAKTNDIPEYDTLPFAQQESYWRDYWEIKYVLAVLTPVLTNNTVRKIQNTVKFDRVTPWVIDYRPEVQYAPGETVRYNQSFYTANAELQVIPTAVIPEGNITVWNKLSDSQIAETGASNRIAALYRPTSNMISNDLTQLLQGAEFSGVRVNSIEFTPTYPVPTGKLSDVEDTLLAKVGVFVQFDDSRVFTNAVNLTQKIRGTQSGSFSTAALNNNLQFGSADSSVTYQVDTNNLPRYYSASASSANINLLAPATDEFTWEFYFRMKENNREQVLLDTRDGVNGGLKIAINDTNQVTVTNHNALFNLVGGDISTNIWHHVAVERKFDTITLYFDGNQIDSYQEINFFLYSFTSSALTLGASYDVDAPTVANALMDELRLTVGKTRYNLQTTYSVAADGFGRNLQDDPDFAYVRLLYSFESTRNEVPTIDINFDTPGARAVIQDLSVNNRILIIENAENLNSNIPLNQPEIWSGSSVYTAGDQVTISQGNIFSYYQAVQSFTGGNISDPADWTPVVPSIPQFEIPAAVFTTANVSLDAGSSLGYNLGLGDFAIEFWAAPDSAVATKTVFELAADTATSFYKMTAQITTVSPALHNVTVTVATASGTVSTLTANDLTSPALFVSVERYNQKMYLFVNGVLRDTDLAANYNFGYQSVAVPLIISSSVDGFTGKLADFRITSAARHIPDTDFDTAISGDFDDLHLGIRPADIIIDGTGFVNSVNSSSTEEHVNGRLYDTLHIKVFSNANIGSSPTGYRMFKDMGENLEFYAIPATSTTLLTANLSAADTVLTVDSTAGFADPAPHLAQLGVVFVGAERIEYRHINRATNQLVGLSRGTRGTAASQHTVGTRVEGANAAESFPGGSGVFAVSHTVQSAAVATAVIQLESVTHIQPNQPVTGTDVTSNTVVVSVNAADHTVTLNSPQTIAAFTVLSFGNIDTVLTQPSRQLTTNSLVAYANTWYSLGAESAADGLGLQRSNTDIAVFLNNNSAWLPG
jgi:hypothetical protein